MATNEVNLSGETTLHRLPMVTSLICLGIFSLAYLTNAIDRQIFPMLLSWISKTYSFDLKEAGLLSTVFTLGVGVAAWPTGFLLDRRSRREVLLIGMVIYSVFTFATIYANGFWDMAFYRTLTGIGEGMQIAALFAAGSAYFWNDKALVIGTINFGFGIGGFIGPYYGTKMTVASNDWHMPFIVFAIMGIVMALVIWFFVPKAFTESKGSQASAIDDAAVANMPKEFWNRNSYLLGAVAIIWGFVNYGYLSLYSTFLIKQLNYAPMVAGTAFGFFGLGAMFGIPAGWLGDRFSNRWVAIITWCCYAVVCFLMYNVLVEPWQQNVLSFMVGLTISSFLHPNCLSLAQRSVRPQFIGRATGYFSSCAYTAATFAGFVFAWLVQFVGWNGAACIHLVAVPMIAVVLLLLVKDSELARKPKKSAT